MRLCLGFLLLTFALSVGASNASAKLSAEVLWDAWGVPHVFAESETAAAYGFGWAQMESRGAQLVRLYGEARGRASEYWGTGPRGEHIISDRWTLTMDISNRGSEWYQHNDPSTQAYIAAFVSGINDCARQHWSDLPAELQQVLPVRPTDVLAHMMRTLQFGFLADPNGIQQAIQSWKSRRRAGKASDRIEPLRKSVTTASEPPGQSTGWAIGPRKSETGRSMLMMNPHLPWHGQDILFEAHLIADQLDFYGATFLGFPVLGMGFNHHLGWTHTVNTIDGADLYELSLAGDGYRWDGAVVQFQSARHVLRTRLPDGRLREQLLDVHSSVHGPVVAQFADKALALRVACLDCWSIVSQYLQMMRAESKDDFVAALRQLQVPLFTVLYADWQGHIMMLFGGRTPARPMGDWAFWHDVVPGDTSSTLWTRELTFDELPFVQDPPAGWLQNANEPPWTTTLPPPFASQTFPTYLAPSWTTWRAQRSLRLLAGNDRLTFNDIVRDKFSTRVELADHVLGALITAAKASGSAKATEAALILERWDRHVNVDSRGAVLFERWAQFARIPRAAVPWTPDDPLATKAGLIDPDEAVKALIRAADEVATGYGTLDIAWGDIHRLSLREGVDVPAAGASDPLGVLRSLTFAPGEFAATGGDSFIATVEFGEKGPHAEALLTYENSARISGSQPAEQLSLYAKGMLRPVWIRRSEIEAHLDHTTLAAQNPE